MTAQQFLKLIEQSSLLPQNLLGKLARKLAETPSVKDASGVARWMVDKGHLSVWQAQQLLAGRNTFYLGRYRLVERIGKGGMGVVFKAQHALMDRVVALKVMSPTLLRNPRAVARFNREVKAAAALQHPNIITAFDADAVGSTHFLVMEYVDGHDLNWWLRSLGPLPISLAAECAMQAAEGLSHAHHLGMVHRDIKPVNLLVAWNVHTQIPTVKILDMGLARFVSESQEDGNLTRLGQAIGTPDYIAPEAAENFKRADIRADIFSLGCTLYKLLTGRLPYGGENTMEKLMARAMADAPPIRTQRPSIPEVLEAVVTRLLARQPENRYQTPAEVVQALRPFAASTLKEQTALQLLARPESESRPALDKVVADADSSLNLFRDLTVAPARETGEGNAGATMVEAFEFGDGGRGGASPSLPDVEELAPLAEPANVLLGEAPDPDEELVAIVDQIDPDSEGSITERLKTSPAAWELPRARRRSVWDSPLILIGSGVLALLLIASLALAWSITRGGGDRAFEAAELEYADGNYGSAVGLYTKYLEGYPRHPKAGLAKVHLGLARLRQAIDTSSNWPKTLELARKEIETIAPLPEFADTGNDLAVLLPRISVGLAADARKTPDKERIAQARASLALMDKYVTPRSLQPAETVAEVQQSLALAERELAQVDRLRASTAEIEKLAAEGNLAEAERVRFELVAAYPNLERAPELQQALAKLTAAAQQATRFISEPRAAETTEIVSPIAATTALATRAPAATATPSAIPAEARVYALAEGAAYALSAADGRVLWRRSVGYDSDLLPVEQPDGSSLAFDAVHQELLSLESASGAFRWRLGLSARPAGSPLTIDDRALVATIDGRLTALAPKDGQAQGYTKFPQPIVGAPTLEPRGRRLYQVGDRAHLYVLDGKSLDCLEVVDLGHAASSVAVSPTVVSRFVIVSENHLARGCRLRVLVADDNGLHLKEVQQLEFEGRIVSPPQVADRYLHVFTDRGGVIVLAVASTDTDHPLTKVIETVTGSEERGPSYARIDGRDLWIGNDRLTKFAVQAAAARIAPQWTIDRGDVFCQPPALLGDALITARKRKTFSGVAVAAVRASDGQPIWQSQLAARPTGLQQVEEPGQRLASLSTTGALFAADLTGASRAPMIDTAVAQVELPAELPWRQTLGAARFPIALLPATSGDRVLLVDPTAQAALAWVTPPAPALAQPIAWRDGWLAPCRPGLVEWFDRQGQRLAEPFQPRTEAGVELPWTSAVALPNGDALLSDGRAKLYRLTLQAEPKPHVAAVKETETPEALVTPLVAGPTYAFGVDAGGHLVGLGVDDLKLGPQIRLPGKPVWGPHRVGSLTLVATDEDRLLAIDDTGRPAWGITLEGGPLVGTPLVQDDALLLALQSGRVQRLAAPDGQVRGTLDVGEPLGAGPLLVGGKLFVLGYDGSIYELRSAP